MRNIFFPLQEVQIMINQLKVELFKIKRFWLLYAGVVLLFLAGFFYGYLKFNESYNTNTMFAAGVGDTSFMFVFSLVSAWFIGNDFSSRTVHNEVKIGYSRFSIIASRTIIVILTSTFLHLTYIVALIGGFSLKYGFDTSVFCLSNLFWLLTVMIQIIGVQCCVVFISFLTKKATAAIAVSVCFTFITCNILRNFLDSSVFRLSSFSLAQNSYTSTLVMSCIYAALMIVAITLLTHITFRKAEIK